MLITLFSLIVAIVMGWFTPVPIDFNDQLISTIMLTGGTAILLAAVYLNTNILIPFEKLEQNLIPNLMELIRRDKILGLGRLYLFLFPLISYICVGFVDRIKDVIHQDWFFLAWIVLFGLCIDTIRDSWHRIVNFLNPSRLVTHISQEAINAIRNDQDTLLWNNIDSLTEIGLTSVGKSKLALSTQTLKSFPPIVEAYLDSAKSISHTYHDLADSKGSGKDEASYAIFYLLQRLEVIHDRALRDRLETVSRQMIMSLGKIIVQCAKYDLSMVAFPTHFLTKFGLKAQQHHFDEVAVLTTSTLLEIAKTILTEIDLTYMELQEPFQSIINGLDAIAKATFKKRKDTSIKALVQPLVDLKEMFQTEKMANHRDTPVIVGEINKSLEEFTILEQVMQTMPPIIEETPK